MIKCIITKETDTIERIYAPETIMSTIVNDNNINPSKSLYANSTLVNNFGKTLGEYANGEDTIYLTSVVKTNNN